jgi:perosamine synthetase
MKPWFGPAEEAAVAAAVSSGWVAQGPRVAEFEQAFATRMDAAHGVATSSCTTALHLALVLAGVGPGEEVVVPSLSFIATANAVRYVGATPVFADVDAATGNVTAKTVAAVITARTRAVIAVHQGGVPADVDEIRVECAPIPVIEDAACAAGSTYRGRPVGAGAAIAAWSFHPRKLLTTGEGGMLTTDRPAWAQRARRLREHGMSVSAADRHRAARVVIEEYLETGFNYRMTDLQAALGLVQLSRLDAMIARRRALAARYQELLATVPRLVTVRDPAYGTTNYQSFWVLLPDDFPIGRDALLQRLADNGISARRGIMAAHLEPAYAGGRRARPTGKLPVTEWLSGRSLILPLFHELTEVDQERIVAVIAEAA